MKKLFSFTLFLCLVLIPVTTAYADVIIEPDNSFYTRHAADCVQVGRSFYAHGADGFVTVMEAPDSKTELGAVENDTVLYVYSTYNHKGTSWGVVDFERQTDDGDPGPIISGWVPMDQLQLKYDRISFAEEHEKEFHPYAGDLSELKAAEQLVFWTYPGSGAQAGIMAGWQEGSELYLETAYTDADGREWGFITYYYGYKNVWVCLSDPANESIPKAGDNPLTGIWQPPERTGSGLPVTLLVIVLVAVLAAGTVILIRVVWKPQK